jgi:hypothetical protein
VKAHTQEPAGKSQPSLPFTSTPPPPRPYVPLGTPTMRLLMGTPTGAASPPVDSVRAERAADTVRRPTGFKPLRTTLAIDMVLHMHTQAKNKYETGEAHSRGVVLLQGFRPFRTAHPNYPNHPLPSAQRSHARETQAQHALVHPPQRQNRYHKEYQYTQDATPNPQQGSYKAP